jgi:ABC-type polysaccharide transport system permease subunit
MVKRVTIKDVAAVTKETQTIESVSQPRKRKRWTANDWVLFAMASLSIVFLAIFAYAPLYGLILAFKGGDGYLDIIRAINEGEWDNENIFTYRLHGHYFDIAK